MAVKGVFLSDSGIQGDPKGDFAAGLLQEDPAGMAPLFALTSGMESSNATDVVVNWFEEQHLTGRTTVNGAVASTTTQNVVLTDASFIVPGNLFMNELTGEYLFAIAVAGNTVTFIRGFAGTTPVNIADASGFQLIANAQEEASNAPIAVVNQGYPVFNYTQIFRNTWNVSGTAKAVSYYTGPVEAKTQRDAMLFHGEAIERALWFGKKTVGTQNGKPFRTMDGVDAFIKTNVTAAGGTTNYSQLQNFLQSVFTYQIKGKPNERIAFCGNNALAVIGEIARIEGRIEIYPGATDFGLNVHRWITPFGNISLMTHPLFNQSPVWTKDLRVLHPGAMSTRWLRRTEEDAYDKNGSRAGVDADYGVFTSELSCQYVLERTGGRLTGLTAAAAVP